MKYWLSHIPLEVWVDVYRYPWISYEELGQIVDRFRNRKYVEYLQFYLHDWGKRQLNNWLCFDKDGLCKYIDYTQHHLHFPQSPMPDNIKSFQRISIRHFDAQFLNFLRQIGPILTNLNLSFSSNSPNEMENLRFILVNIVPLLDKINSLSFDACALPTVKHCFGEEFNKIKVLKIWSLGPVDEAAVQALVDVLLGWLLPAQDDSIGPRYCKTALPDALFEKVSPAIRQQFFAAKTPRTLALDLCLSYQAWQQFVDFHFTNNIGEELHGVKIEDGSVVTHVQITRHRAKCAAMHAWIEAYKSTGSRTNRILIQNPTIGLFDAVDVPKDGEEAQQEPSTSKKARIA